MEHYFSKKKFCVWFFRLNYSWNEIHIDLRENNVHFKLPFVPQCPHRHHHRLKGLTGGGSSNERHFSKPHFLWLVQHQPTVKLLYLQEVFLCWQLFQLKKLPSRQLPSFFFTILQEGAGLENKAKHCVVTNCSAPLRSKMAKLKRGKLHLYSRDILPWVVATDQYLQAHGCTITLVDWSAFTPRIEESARTTMTLPATNCPLFVRR